MTKKIRIENADTSNHKVRAYVEDLVDGRWVRDPNTRPIELDHPTTLADAWVHSTRRVVIEEVE